MLKNRKKRDVSELKAQLKDAHLAQMQSLAASKPAAAAKQLYPRRTLFPGTERALSRKLFRAAMSGNAFLIMSLAFDGADVNYRNPEFSLNTALHEVARRGHVSAMDRLLDCGASRNVKNDAGNTPLHLAVSSNHLECVEMLLNAGAYVDPSNMLGETPLHLAALYGTESMIKTLTEDGAYRKAKTLSGDTPKDLAKDDVKRALL